MEVQAGDIVCTRGTGWLSRLIRVCTRVVGEARTQVNHVGILVEGGSLASVVIVEAVRRVVRRPFYAQYHPGTGQEIAIFRRLSLPPDAMETVVRAAEAYVGRPYGYIKLVAHLLDWCLLGAYVFRRVTCLDRYPICSWLVAHAYVAAGVTFGVPAGAATPDDIWDACTAHPERYLVIHPLGPLPAQP